MTLHAAMFATLQLTAALPHWRALPVSFVTLQYLVPVTACEGLTPARTNLLQASLQ
jgi:hypothetical protein